MLRRLSYSASFCCGEFAAAEGNQMLCPAFRTPAGETNRPHSNYEDLVSYGVKFIERVNPLFIFAENVSGLTSANNDKAFKLLSNLPFTLQEGYTRR